jgi:hypothetical protein
MVALMALFAALLAACGVGLVGLGIGMSLENELATGSLSVAFGLLTLYGGYLFGRGSWRTRAAIRGGEVSEVKARRTKVKVGVGFGPLSAVSAIFMPGSGAVTAIFLAWSSLASSSGWPLRLSPEKRSASFLR